MNVSPPPEILRLLYDEKYESDTLLETHKNQNI